MVTQSGAEIIRPEDKGEVICKSKNDGFDKEELDTEGLGEELNHGEPTELAWSWIQDRLRILSDLCSKFQYVQTSSGYAFVISKSRGT